MTVVEITAEVGADRQVHLPPECPIGTHRLVIYVDDSSSRLPKEIPLRDPPLRRKNGLLVLNLPEEPIWFDTDRILNEVREERLDQLMGPLR